MGFVVVVCKDDEDSVFSQTASVTDNAIAVLDYVAVNVHVACGHVGVLTKAVVVDPPHLAYVGDCGVFHRYATFNRQLYVLVLMTIFTVHGHKEFGTNRFKHSAKFIFIGVA